MVSIACVPLAGWYAVQVLVGRKVFFLYFKTTWPALGPTQPPANGFCPQIKLAGPWSQPLLCI